MADASFTLTKGVYREGIANHGAIVGLPGISLVPCIPNKTRENRMQVNPIGVVILEGNGFIAWIIHGVDDECLGGVQQEGKDTGVS